MSSRLPYTGGCQRGVVPVVSLGSSGECIDILTRFGSGASPAFERANETSGRVVVCLAGVTLPPSGLDGEDVHTCWRC
jgi:hypothetical protein